MICLTSLIVEEPGATIVTSLSLIEQFSYSQKIKLHIHLSYVLVMNQVWIFGIVESILSQNHTHIFRHWISVLCSHNIFRSQNYFHRSNFHTYSLHH